MKRLYLVSCMFLLCAQSYAQKMEFLRKSETFRKNGKSNAFHYWSVADDTLGLTYVATLQARGTAMNGGKNLYELWLGCLVKSRKTGANAFIFRSFQDSDSTQPVLVLDLYFADEAAIARNDARMEKNVVYLFGNKGKPMPVKVNGEDTDIPANAWLRYETPAGNELKLSKGGAGGAHITIRPKEEQAVEYFSVSGFGLGGMVPPPGTVGLSFNTGRISPVPVDFGGLMLEVMRKTALPGAAVSR
ncbi:hypothetical protein ACQKLP_13135 [Chitinophaga sp. NPDC101104]|uniref:hypothetical protein n=1 Tax=Chitinophaga sp. NPDC101104 TaxID=3390561 RepID=UPI003D089D67